MRELLHRCPTCGSWQYDIQTVLQLMSLFSARVATACFSFTYHVSHQPHPGLLCRRMVNFINWGRFSHSAIITSASSVIDVAHPVFRVNERRRTSSKNCHCTTDRRRRRRKRHCWPTEVAADAGSNRTMSRVIRICGCETVWAGYDGVGLRASWEDDNREKNHKQRHGRTCSRWLCGLTWLRSN